MADNRRATMGKGKEAVVVVGALAFAWLAIELALKPFLSKTRESIDKSDPTRDPDDDVPPPPAAADDGGEESVGDA
ncbi:outer envelope membrane protein 7 [Lotus japonicus]|uniref:outer envelope membrane protein 7 n=1 Tax=Lotus japonicus TaxID=34305 RepID=UPI0025867438|nr:outer envelope membrane protein 7 [Lotus japonicus]